MRCDSKSRFKFLQGNLGRLVILSTSILEGTLCTNLKANIIVDSGFQRMSLLVVSQLFEFLLVVQDPTGSCGGHVSK